jgi:hypothetical protein
MRKTTYILVPWGVVVITKFYDYEGNFFDITKNTYLWMDLK